MQRFRVVIASDGQIGFFAEDGTTAQGAANIAAMLKTIADAGITVSDVTPVERHRPGADENLERLHDATHAHEHCHQ